MARSRSLPVTHRPANLDASRTAFLDDDHGSAVVDPRDCGARGTTIGDVDRHSEPASGERRNRIRGSNSERHDHTTDRSRTTRDNDDNDACGAPPTSTSGRILDFGSHIAHPPRETTRLHPRGDSVAAGSPVSSTSTTTFKRRRTRRQFCADPRARDDRQPAVRYERSQRRRRRFSTTRVGQISSAQTGQISSGGSTRS